MFVADTSIALKVERATTKKDQSAFPIFIKRIMSHNQIGRLDEGQAVGIPTRDRCGRPFAS